MDDLERFTYDKISLLIAFKSPVALHRLKTKYNIKNTKAFRLAAAYVSNFLYQHHFERALYTASIETDEFIPRTQLPRFIPLVGRISHPLSKIIKPHHHHHSHSHSHHSSHLHSDDTLDKSNGTGEVHRPFFQFSEPGLTYKQKKKLFMKRADYTTVSTQVDPNDMARARLKWKDFNSSNENQVFYFLPPEMPPPHQTATEGTHSINQHTDQHSSHNEEETKQEEVKSQPTKSTSQSKSTKSPYKRKPRIVYISQSKDKL